MNTNSIHTQSICELWGLRYITIQSELSIEAVSKKESFQLKDKSTKMIGLYRTDR